jgi:hypothetical protein
MEEAQEHGCERHQWKRHSASVAQDQELSIAEKLWMNVSSTRYDYRHTAFCKNGTNPNHKQKKSKVPSWFRPEHPKENKLTDKSYADTCKRSN